MKHTLYLITLFAGFLLTISSCKKDAGQLPPETIDSLKSVLPKQIIWTTNTGSDELITKVISIKYDTLNRQIGLYIDDTTNTNPYDHLAASYIYNDDGYLIKTTGLFWPYSDFSDYESGISNITEIKRDAGNNIVHITDWAYATDVNISSPKDTTFYFYEKTRSGGTNITTIRFNRENPFFNDTISYQYDNTFKILEFDESKSGITTYQYNSNNSLNKITSFFDQSFFYDSIIGEKQEDLLLNLFIGKDHYLPQLQGLYPFRFYAGIMYGYINGIITTNPYHPNQVTQTNAYPFSEGEAKLFYEYNDHKLLSKVTLEYNGQLKGMARFKY